LVIVTAADRIINFLAPLDLILFTASILFISQLPEDKGLIL